MDRVSEERIARNDDVFRKANENLCAAAAELGFDGTRVPFLCECAEETCTTIVVLELDAYRRVRGNPRWFLVAPGHEGEAEAAASTVERADGFVIVEKDGHAGEIAERLAA